MHFDLVDLRLFLNIVESGSITAGAALTHLSLASASARVRGLEASLGIALLERGRRGVTATAVGKALALHARAIGRQVGQMQADLAEYAKGFKGQVRLLCNTSALSEYLPERLADFLVAHPNVDIDVQEMPSVRIVAAVRQGAADLGLISSGVDCSGLQSRFLQDDPMVLVIPPGHPLSGSPGATFVAALAYEFIGVAPGTAFSVLIEEHALQAGYRMQIRARAENFEGMLRMVARGAGLGIAPKACVERLQGSLAIESLPLTEPWADRKLLLCSRSFDELPPYAAALVAGICAVR
jgi:DNA-binding transcriptional LysR family regulator